MSEFPFQSSIAQQEKSAHRRAAQRKEATKAQERMRIRITHFLALFIVGTWIILSFLTQDSVGSEVIVTCIILAFVLLVEFQNFDALKNSYKSNQK